jgi:hypothetical protein
MRCDLEGEPLYGLCCFGFLPEELQGEAFLYGKGDTIDVTWTPTEQKLTFSRRHSIEKCETFLPGGSDGSVYKLYAAFSSVSVKIELVE